MSNFDFLKDFDKDFYKLAYLMEYYLDGESEKVADYAQAVLKRLLNHMLNRIGLEYVQESYFESQLNKLLDEDVISESFKNRILWIFDITESGYAKTFQIAFQLNPMLFYLSKKIISELEIPSYSPVEIDYSELEKWYVKELSFFKRNEKDEFFVYYNELLVANYLDFLDDGVDEAEIRRSLHIDDETYDFLLEFDSDFRKDIIDVKRDLIKRYLAEGKARDEIISLTSLTPRQYDDIVKVADFNRDDLSMVRKLELNTRKKRITDYLPTHSLEKSCELSGITLKEFFNLFENGERQFIDEVTEILMEKYLKLRSSSVTRLDAIRKIGLNKDYLQRWLNWSDYAEFQKRDLELTLQIIMEGFAEMRPKKQIAKNAELDIKALNDYIRQGREGSVTYREMYQFYEDNAVPVYLDNILNAKSIKTALESSDLEKSEFTYYYELGKSGDERYVQFYKDFLEAKKNTYVKLRNARKSHKIAFRESLLSDKEYQDVKDDLDKALKLIKLDVVKSYIEEGRNTTVAAGKARVTVDEIYEWYFKGRDGDEDYVEFYEFLHSTYVKPRLDYIHELLANKEFPDFAKNRLNRKDLEIWVDNDLLYSKVVSFDEPEEEREHDPQADELLAEMGYRGISKVKPRVQSPTILNRQPEDIEKMKREILRK